jgi:hypothetical protein
VYNTLFSQPLFASLFEKFQSELSRALRRATTEQDEAAVLKLVVSWVHVIVKRRAWHSQADTRKKELATRAISAATREPVQTALKSVSGERMLVHIKAVKKVRKERYDRVELIKRRSAAGRGRAAPGRDDDDDVDRPADVARADDDFPEVCACACVCLLFNLASAHGIATRRCDFVFSCV